VKVSWHLRQQLVEVAVSDGGGPTMPIVSEPTNWSVGGRGLGIVSRLSLRWGVCAGEDHWDSDHDHDGVTVRNGRAPDAPRGCAGDGGHGETTVWAELPVRYGTSASLVIASSRDA
jgi:hypothetical protein